MKTNSKLIIAIISLAITVMSCNRQKKEGEEKHESLPSSVTELNEEQYRTADIRLSKISRINMSGEIKLNGHINVTPQNLATVCAPMGGFIKSTSQVQGSTVRKGQVLAVIENMEFVQLQQNYLEIRAKFEYSEIEYKRHGELYKENVYSAKNFQETESEYKILKAQLKGLEKKLAILGINPGGLREDNIRTELPIVSPIDGYIKSVSVNIGKYVNPSDALFEVINSGNIVLELVAFEKDIMNIGTGQKVRFYSPDAPANLYQATVYQAGTTLDNDKTARVYASIDKPVPGLVAGMYVNASIQITNHEVTAVPEKAIVRFDEKSYIFVYRGKVNEGKKIVNRFEMIEVKTGNSNDGFTEVSLPEGFQTDREEIVINGAYTLLSALKNSGEMEC